MYNECAIEELQHLIATKSDQQAYAELFNRYAKSLVHFADSLIHDEQSSEEIVSDVFIRVWERRNSLDQIGNLRMYLYISVRNFSINFLRRQKRQATISLSDLPVDTLPESDFLPNQLVEMHELLGRMKQAVDALPPKCGLIFKLSKEDGLQQKEIAELLQVSPKTVENQMTIALRKIGQSIRHLTGKVIRLRS
jgi:RNA polymerase sigma-70 factor (family 1)